MWHICYLEPSMLFGERFGHRLLLFKSNNNYDSDHIEDDDDGVDVPLCHNIHINTRTNNTHMIIWIIIITIRIIF